MQAYSDLPQTAFWRTGTLESDPLCLEGIESPQRRISPRDKVATAGSCFAQHVSRFLRDSELSFLDVEPAPRSLPADRHSAHGYSMYSARYGNIYTVRQLLQLVKEVRGEHEPRESVWEKEGRFFDVLRPGVTPDGLDDEAEVRAHRSWHLERLQELFATMDVFIFTMGLTEAWEHIQSGTVYPTAPGVLAGSHDPNIFAFHNFNYEEVLADFLDLQALLTDFRSGKDPLRYVLTVSPVPLTATASGKHVLSASTYSKAVLRAVAGHLSDTQEAVDYFPSYEIVTNPAARSSFFADNLRSVTPQGVHAAMSVFLRAHGQTVPELGSDEQSSTSKPMTDAAAEETDLECEEALLEAFSR